MLCKSCNTRLADGTRTCPQCGHIEQYPSKGRAKAAPKLSKSNLGGVPRSTPDLELRDEVPASGGESSAKRGGGGAANKSRKAGGKSADKGGTKAAPKSARRRSAPAAPEAPDELFAINSTQIRAILADQPELLEAGLRPYEDDSGEAIGVGFDTEVGEIDFLGLDDRDSWVVVWVAGEEEDLASGMLQRLGWVRKHMTKGGEAVRGIALVVGEDPELDYATAALVGTVEFRTCRVTVRFDTVEV